AGRAGPRVGELSRPPGGRRADRKPRFRCSQGGSRPAARDASGRSDAAPGHPRRARGRGGGSGDYPARRAGFGREGVAEGAPGRLPVRRRSLVMTGVMVRLAFAGIRTRLLASALTILLSATVAATVVIA